MRRSTVTKRLLPVALIAAGATVLTACQQPKPEVTVLFGSTTVRLDYQTYCFDPSHCHLDPKQPSKTIKAQAGSTIFVDVPRTVADSNWSVESAVSKDGHIFSAITGGLYSSGPISNRHSTTVTVPDGAGSYFLVVRQASSGGSGTWIAKVTIEH